MAFISTVKHQSIKSPKKHSSIKATYDIFEVNGEKILQITSYGRDSREFPEKASQIVQFDQQALLTLHELIQTHFK